MMCIGTMYYRDYYTPIVQNRMLTINTKPQHLVDGYLWAYINRPDLLHICWHTRKQRTRKKLRNRLVKEWRKSQ